MTDGHTNLYGTVKSVLRSLFSFFFTKQCIGLVAKSV